MIAKRFLDIMVSSCALVLLSPVLLSLAVAVRQSLGRPVLFRQSRPGLYGKLFDMFKFRTMTDETDREGRPLPDQLRLTPFGAWLRSTSLDELPELWNVLKGDMSLVGPRPLLEQYLPLYSARQARRHEVRPGLTGWAQVNGRNTLAWEDRLEMDVWYVDNRTFLLDLQILYRTMVIVFSREGITDAESATQRPFTGNRKHKGQR
ncbi:MAG: sugar transferase [Hyphomicrobiales bacterium]